MKKLVCSYCQKPALARVNPLLYLTIGRVSSPRISFKDARCGRVTHMTSKEVMQQPNMTDAEIRAKTCDVDLPPETKLEPKPTA